MEKFIGCVEHQNGHITTVRVFETDTSTWRDYPRAKVVGEIQSRLHTYRTWYYNPQTKKWENGPLVRTVLIEGTWYLRTDDNKLAADNLGSLPTLAACPFPLPQAARSTQQRQQ